MVFKSSKAQEVQEEASLEVPQTLPVQSQQANLTNIALSIYKNINDGNWYIAKMQYNPTTGETGNFSAKSTGSSYRDEAEYQFKLAAVEQVFNS